jgi:enoyl-[acyl-carrier protein] reductase I
MIPAWPDGLNAGNRFLVRNTLLDTPRLLNDRVGIVFGVANERSIAWAIAKKLSLAGAKLVVTYQDDRLLKKVQPLADSLESCMTVKCDLTEKEDVERAFSVVEKEYGGLDILVHSVAFALKEDLEGRYVDTSEKGFEVAHNISSYTLTSAARAARPLMERRGGGTVMAMSYHGSVSVIPHYNVMGLAKASLEAGVRYLAADLGEFNIRVNALSPGPLNTLAARGIARFPVMLKMAREKAPLKRKTELDEVADAALFLASDLSRGITGEVIYVDCGCHIMGL